MHGDRRDGGSSIHGRPDRTVRSLDACIQSRRAALGRQFQFGRANCRRTGFIGCRPAQQDRERRLWRTDPFERPSVYGGCTFKPVLAWRFFGRSDDWKWPRPGFPGARRKLSMPGRAIAPKVRFVAPARTHTGGHKLTLAAGGYPAARLHLDPARRMHFARGPQPAAIRQGQVRRLSPVRHLGPRLPSPSPRRLRARQAGRLQLQSKRVLPIMRSVPDVADRGASIVVCLPSRQSVFSSSTSGDGGRRGGLYIRER